MRYDIEEPLDHLRALFEGLETLQERQELYSAVQEFVLVQIYTRLGKRDQQEILVLLHHKAKRNSGAGK